MKNREPLVLQRTLRWMENETILRTNPFSVLAEDQQESRGVSARGIAPQALLHGLGADHEKVDDADS